MIETRFTQSFTALVLAVASCAAALPSAVAHAEVNEGYIAALKIAEKAVEREKRVENHSGALTSGLLKTLFGRYYQKGDSWDVVAVRIDPYQGPDPDGKPVERAHGVFHYQVVDVKPGADPEVLIHVTQTTVPGEKVVDPKIDKLVLRMNDHLVQSEKNYYFTGRAQPVVVAPDSSIRTSVTPLELFPLDAPEVDTAERSQVTQLPPVPKSIQAIVNAGDYHPDLAHGYWFEQTDFFGRPIQMLWEQGNPWPTYLKTSTGVAILIHKAVQ